MKFFAAKSEDACEVHGSAPRSGNRMLAAMLLVTLSLMAWHLRVVGPTVAPSPSPEPFPALFARELWDLLFNRHGILAELWEVFPYFLVGILLAGYLRTYKVAVKLQGKLKKYGILSVFVASFVGIITPLCACGTVTTAMSLLLAGLPLAPVMSLMVTSPLMSPSTYLLTLNDLGPEWTAVRTVSALLMGIFGGLVTHYLSKKMGLGRRDIFIEGAIVRGDFHDEDYPDERLRCNCRRTFGNRVALKTGNNFLIFLAKSSEMLWTVGKYVVVGVFIGTVVERYMPREWIYRFFAGDDPLNIVWVTLASVPMFLHQISASSIIHHIKASLDTTLHGGAALAFIIGGPVTAVPTMVLFWSFFRKKVFFLYMGVCLAGTILVALLFQVFVFVPGVDFGNSLFDGVGTVSGGPARSIVRNDGSVRIVMAQQNRGTVATFSDDTGGRGAIVFDGTAERFSAAAIARHDNGRYVENIARWLSRNGSSPQGNSILLYGTGDDTKASAAAIESLSLRLVARGFTVRTANRKVTPITPELLPGSGQTWLIPGSGQASPLSDAEVNLLAYYNRQGNGLLLVPTDPQGGWGGADDVNRVASRFGATFGSTVNAGATVTVSRASQALAIAAGVLRLPDR